MTRIRLDAFGEDAAQLPALDLHIIGPADPQRRRRELHLDERINHRHGHGQRQLGLGVALRPCTAGSIARVNVRLPESDHHVFVPRPRPRVCRGDHTQSGRAIPPLRTSSAARSLVDATASGLTIDLTNGQGSASDRTGAVTRRSLPAQTE